MDGENAANYFLKVITAEDNRGERPIAPWM